MAHQFCLVSYTKCYIELIDPRIKIDSLTNFTHFPCNLMTKYGRESGSIAISHLKSWD